MPQRWKFWKPLPMCMISESNRQSRPMAAPRANIRKSSAPPRPRAMMLECGFTPAQADRVAYLVGHHHTYTNINGMDYQILVEADFLVNLYEDSVPKAAAQNALDKIFSKRRQAKQSAKKCLCCKRYYDKFSARNRRLTHFQQSGSFLQRHQLVR